MQVMEAVQNAVQTGIEQLSQTNVTSNGAPIAEEGGYHFQARTREELLKSQQEAAEARGIDPKSRFSQLQDPATGIPGTPSWDVTDIEVQSPSGLTLPQGAKRLVPPKPPAAPTPKSAPSSPKPPAPPKGPSQPQGWLM